MCGEETTFRPRGGALAVLHPSRNDAAASPALSASTDLYLLTPGKPACDQASHAVLKWAGDAPKLNASGILHVFVRYVSRLWAYNEYLPSTIQHDR